MIHRLSITIKYYSNYYNNIIMKKIAQLLTLSLLAGALTVGLTGCRRDGAPVQPGTGGEGGSTQVEEKKPTDLKILEIFYAGTTTTRTYEGKALTTPYEEDAFIKIYNPTDKVLYLDSLVLAVNSLDPSEQINLVATDKKDGGTADYHLKNFLVGAMLQFPGTGKDHPIQPGEAVIIAQKAINHKAHFEAEMKEYEEDLSQYDYSRLIDLSGAAYTWDEEVDAKTLLPQVFNASAIDKVEKAANGWEPDEMNDFRISGHMSLALIRLKSPISTIRESFVSESKLSSDERAKATYFQEVSFISTHHSNQKFALKISNDQVIDAVSVCPMGDKKMQILSPELDKGSHGVEKKGDDPKKFVSAGKSIVRKWDGKGYVDDNNSTSDFEAKSVNPTTKLIKE